MREIAFDTKVEPVTGHSMVLRARTVGPQLADALLAMVAAAFALSGLLIEPSNALEFRSPDLLAAALLALATVPIAWRRKRPIVVLAIVQAATMPYLVLNYNPTTFWVGLVVAIYTVAAYCNTRTSIIALSVFSVVQFLFTLLGALNAPQEVGLDVFINQAVLIAGCWGLGVSVRTRRAYTTELEERARRLEREQEESAQKAVAAEQRRIARELHDVIAHNVSMMVVQSGAARRVLEEEPGLARDALCSIEEAGRGALTEMRRLLGVLREGERDEDALAPQPGMERLDALVSHARAAGLNVDLTVTGEPRPLSAGVDLSAFRIVQEALTNALRHAGPSTTRVEVDYGSSALRLRVLDDGRGASSGNGSGALGHGILGMRERVALFGGELKVGPRAGGGYEVLAELPLETS